MLRVMLSEQDSLEKIQLSLLKVNKVENEANFSYQKKGQKGNERPINTFSRG